jgi:hypothetical protein
MRAVAAAGPSPKDEEIEAFYSDNSEIVRLLLAVVNAVVFDPAAAGEAYRIYANHFWARARCAWVDSEGDSRISEILIQPVGWAEASRRWQSLIRKTCVTA